MSEEPEDHARDQARSQLEGVRELVAALNVDFDRLEELQGDYDSLREAIDDAIEKYDQVQSEYMAARDENAATYEDELEQACETLTDAENFLYTWPDREEFEDLKRDAGEFANREEVEERIQEDPLSVQVRSGWYSPGETPEPGQFEILLCTGGPAVRIMGELDQHNEPAGAWLEYQDWGTPWTLYYEQGAGDVLVEYARQFYFGE